MKIKKVVFSHCTIITFLLFYVVFSLFTFRNYGITGDEPYAYYHGKALGMYLSGHKKQAFSLLTTVTNGDVEEYFNLYDGVYTLALNTINPSFSIDTFHLSNLLFGILLFLSSYIILFKKYKNQLLSIIASVLLFLMPRLLGEIPGNPKDVPFAIVFFLSLSALLFLQNYKNTVLKTLILGILFGVSQSLRIVGITLFPIMLLFDLYQAILRKELQTRNGLVHFVYKETVKILLIFIIATFILAITWPYIGNNFFNNYWETIRSAKNFKFWDGTVLLFGKMYATYSRPWFYLPVWFLFTTPVFILFFFFYSLIFIKNKVKNDVFILCVIALIINFAIYIFLHPVVYSGLRHFLFLLPLVVIIAAMSAIELILHFKPLYIKAPILFLSLINIVMVLFAMRDLHPYEYIYFNEFAGGLKGANGNFETDYWGASYKEAVHWLITNKLTDKKKVYSISMCLPPFHAQYYFLANMKWSSPQNATYFLCHADSWWPLVTTQKKTIHTITRDGVALTYIFKLK